MKNHLVLCFAISFFSSSVFAGEHFKKVVWVIFENMNYEKVLPQKDFKAISQKGVLLTKFTAETHPSQGNYIAMIAGSKLGVKNDNVIDLKETQVGDLLEKANMRWKVYAEDFPGQCFKGKTSGQYARKHVPFMSFLNVSENASRCMNIEDETNFDSDFKNGNLAEFTMYIPNMKNDGHDTNVDYAGKWLTQKMGAILSKPEALGDVLFIITFDESGSSSVNNQIYTVLVGSKLKANFQSPQPLNHPALLKMIEDELGIGNLGREDSTAPIIQGIWK